MICRALLFVLLSALAPAAGAIHHVAPDGADTNPGTEAQPWRTLAKAAASVQPGDTVRIRAGDYFEKSGWNLTRAGTAEKPITYQAFGDGEVRITPSWTIPAGSWTPVRGGIYSTRTSQRPAYVFRNAYPIHPPGERGKIHAVDDMFPNSSFVEGATLYVWLEDGSDPNKSVMRAAASHVVNLRDCHHTIFDGLTLEFGFNGFKDQGKATHHVTYRNCTLRSIGSQGIQPVARESVIEGNLFQKIGVNKFTHGIYNSKPRLIVRHNIFEEIAGAAIHQYHQGDPPAGPNCEFYGNIFRGPRKVITPPVRPAQGRPVRQAQGRPGTGGTNAYYTEIIAWGEGSNQIHHNVFYSEGKRSGVSLNSPGNRVHDNVFVGTPRPILYHAGKTGNEVVNNIVQDVGTMHYVATNGDDGASGTIDQPLRTVAKAVAKLKPGDTIVLRAGRYPPVELQSLQGNADAWITFRAHPGERVTIDHFLKKERDVPACLYLFGRCSFLVFEGFELTNSNPLIDELRPLDPGNPADLARWLPHVEGRPSGIHAYGVRINGPSAPPAPHHLVFRNLEIHHFLGMGSSGGGDDLQFLDNHVYDLGRPRSGYGWYTSGNRHVYRGNVVHDTIFGFHLYSEGGKRPLRDSLIEHNVIHHNGGVRYYHMSSRKVHGGGAGLLVVPGENNIIRHNLVINNGADGIRISSSNTTVTHNTIYGNRGQPIRSEGRNTVIRDNVFHRAPSDVRGP